MEEVAKKEKKCLAGKIAIYGGCTLVFLFIEFLFFLLLKLICFGVSLIAFLLFLGLHYLLLRFAVLKYIFIGSTSLIIKIMLRELNNLTAGEFKNEITRMKNILFKSTTIYSIQSLGKEMVETYCNALTEITKTITSYLRINDIVANKYKTSKYLKNLCSELHVVKNSIEDSDIINIMHEFLVKANNSSDPDTYSFKDFKDDYSFEVSQKYHKNVKSAIINLEKTEELIDDFLLNKTGCSMIENFFFNDSFGSIHQLKIELVNRFNSDEIKIPTNDPKIFVDALLIKAPNNSGANEKKLIILCSPNGAPYEYYAYQDKWLYFYNSMGIDLLLWNYRGYGETKGIATFENIAEDAEKVLQYMKEYSHWDFIGVHGQSIGALAACKLAGKNLVDFCFADRAFSSVENIVYNFKFGTILYYVYKSLLLGNSYTAEDYIKSKAYKIFSSDPLDNIVPDAASLKYQIAKIKVKELKGHDLLNLGGNEGMTVAQSTKDTENVSPLKEIFRQEEYTNFVQAIIYLIERMDTMEREYAKLKSQNSPSREKLSPRDPRQLVSPRDMNLSPRDINISPRDMSPRDNNRSPEISPRSPRSPRVTTSETLQKSNESFNISLVKADGSSHPSENSPSRSIIKYDKMNVETELSIVKTDGDLTGDHKKDEELRVLKSLKILLLRLDTCGDTLFSIYDQYPKISPKAEEIINKFFTILLIFGSYKVSGNIVSDKKVVYKAAAKKIGLVIERLCKILNNPGRYFIANEQTVGMMKTLRDGLMKFEMLFHKIVFKNEDQNEVSVLHRNNRSDVSISAIANETMNFNNFDSSTTLSDFIEEMNIGEVIPLKCGHSGVLDDKELEAYQLHLFKAKIKS